MKRVRLWLTRVGLFATVLSLAWLAEDRVRAWNQMPAAPAATPHPGTQTPAPGGGKTEHVGIASYYGAAWNGRETASGETFDDGRHTAAHRTLPLGTRAKVTNLKNGKSVTVKINDRGPYVKGRKIDLSRAAARKIGISKEIGLAKVRIEPRTPLPPKDLAEQPRRSSTDRAKR